MGYCQLCRSYQETPWDCGCRDEEEDEEEAETAISETS